MNNFKLLCCGFVALLAFASSVPGKDAIEVTDAERSVARELLLDSRPAAEREAMIAKHAGKAAALVAAMTGDMPEDSKEEYRRIPWIWRVSIAAGRANQTQELKELLAVSLPEDSAPLRDWQAVVIGGGIINGITQAGAWPDERVHQLLRGDKDLARRWARTLELSSTMVDNDKVATGTRYDALRIIGLDTWEKRGPQLLKYLDKNINDELQMGAVSGLGDMRSPKVIFPLINSLEWLSEQNRELALGALLRDDTRAAALLDAVAANQVKKSLLGDARIKKLLAVKSDRLRAQAESVFMTQLAVEKKSRDYMVGVASVDVTPAYPVRLSGYAVRKTESDGVTQRIYAKALAIGSDREGVALLMTVDNVGVPEWMRTEVLKRLQGRTRVADDHFALCSTHTHSAPMLKDNLPTLFGEDIPKEHQDRIAQYSAELLDKLEQVALAALNGRAASKLLWGKTKAEFAANRRTKGGPVDHDLPVLAVTDKTGKLRAIFANYACHCTTLGGDFNQICGDWAGYAQEYLERDHTGVTALIGIGCGADANPAPRPGLDQTKKHGQSIASAVNQLLGEKLVTLNSRMECRAKRIALPFDQLPSTQEWEERSKKADYAGYQARKILERLDKGELLPTEMPYLVQAWNFGDQLAMVFLPGEVVVDYSLRLKQEYDPKRMWVNAYANDVPCYIPSKRIWTEGGYEGGGAMIFYDKPARLAENTEELIFGALHELLPEQFAVAIKPQAAVEGYNSTAAAQTPVAGSPEAPAPKEATEVYRTFERKPGFVVSVAASEPAIVDPVAIDFSTDGKLWVAEMHDYPSGMDGEFKPGGRVKLLRDSDGDGEFDQSTIFLDELSFPTGLMQWREGVIVCAAPDILYAEDTDGDGKADLVRKLFTGFATHNYQARVNSLRWGLDNWVYGSGGLFGGKIKSEITGKEIECSGRDFRMNPDTGELEPVAGISQQGRARDDWGNWFGCDNSTLLWHFPLPDRYVRRNPHVTPPEPRIYPIKDNDPNLLFPVSRTLERFNRPESANRSTSVSGLEIYRDNVLGEEFYGDSFSGETVHNLVRRFKLERQGALFAGRRAEDEQRSEFFASTDNWFRPVEIRTGPDGALWIVDMYRFVIEHPRWIPAERLASLDVRAGDDKGRVYRVYPYGAELRKVRDLTKLSGRKLAVLLDTPNGTMRDLIHREIYQRQDKTTVPALKKLVRDSKIPAVRVQALCILDGLGVLWPEDVYNALIDDDPNVRANAIRLSEDFLSNGRTTGREGITDLGWNPAFPLLKSRMLELAEDSSGAVRFQLALSMGEWADPRAGHILAKIATTESSDPWMRAAVLTSAQPHVSDILNAVLAMEESAPGREQMIGQLIATAAGSDSNKSLLSALSAIAPATNEPPAAWQLNALANLQETLERRKTSLSSVVQFAAPEARSAVERIEKVIENAGDIARDSSATAQSREVAIRLMGGSKEEKDVVTLVQLATAPGEARLQKAAQNALRRQQHAKVPELLVAGWGNYLVSLRPMVLEILFSRDEGTKRALAAVEAGVIAPSEIPATIRQQLLAHENDDIKSRAANLFPVNDSRKAILSKLSTEVPRLIGNPGHGYKFFTEACANCHTLRGEGTAVGPDLTPLNNKTTEDFLLAIIDPTSVIEPRFVQYNLELKDGRSLSGVINAETATSVTLLGASGTKEIVLRSDITEMRASSLSLMPEGLEEGRTAQDFADLIAYLKAPPAKVGQGDSEKNRAARKKFLDEGSNGFARLIGSSEQLPWPGWIGTFPLAHCRQTDGKSKVTWESAAVNGEIKPDQTYSFRLPVAMGLNSQPSGKFSLSINGKLALYFDVALSDKTWSSSDGKVSMRYQVMENDAEDSNGVLTISVKGDMLQSGQPVTFDVAGSATSSQRWFGIYLIPGGERASR